MRDESGRLLAIVPEGERPKLPEKDSFKHLFDENIR
jgi:hypothetical protein